jgi:peptide/nickel transport system substrate-binding protein
VKGKNPFKDKRVRQALSLAIDREAIQRATMRGLSLPGRHHGGAGRQRPQADIDVVPRPTWTRQEAAGRGRLPERLRVAS